MKAYRHKLGEQRATRDVLLTPVRGLKGLTQIPERRLLKIA